MQLDGELAYSAGVKGYHATQGGGLVGVRCFNHFIVKSTSLWEVLLLQVLHFFLSFPLWMEIEIPI